MHSLDEFARTKLAALEAQSLRRELMATDRVSATEVMRHGHRLVSFSCNDYLGLAHDPRVKAAAAAAVARYGAGAGASRLVSGNHPLLQQLEERLARRKRKPAALVFGSGYLANIGLPGALAGTGDLIAIDELAHASMHAGARLSGARVLTFRHNDLQHLADLLVHERPAARRVLILTERIFSMDGDQAPLRAMGQLAERNDAWLLADDAHGLGVAEHDGDVPLDMGTLSKALGSYGGYVCSSAPVISLLQGRARSFVYSTGLPPASAAAALTALDIMDAEPEKCLRPRLLARRFAQALNLPDPASAIVPLIVGEAGRALALSAALERAGFLVVAIRPPTVPVGSARLRFTFSAAHSDAQVDALIDVVTNVMSKHAVLSEP
jgi:8-amino-7-oxononanoate synthase